MGPLVLGGVVGEGELGLVLGVLLPVEALEELVVVDAPEVLRDELLGRGRAGLTLVERLQVLRDPKDVGPLLEL